MIIAVIRINICAIIGFVRSIALQIMARKIIPPPMRKSKKATAIKLPAAKAKKYGINFLNLRIINPPNKVETSVARARP